METPGKRKRTNLDNEKNRRFCSILSCIQNRVDRNWQTILQLFRTSMLNDALWVIFSSNQINLKMTTVKMYRRENATEVHSMPTGVRLIYMVY